jgi:hypothetical protein
MRVRFPRERVYRAVAQKRCLFSWLLHSNGCTRCLFRNICLATDLYGTISYVWYNRAVNKQEL